MSSDFEIKIDSSELEDALKRFRARDLTAPLSVLGDDILDSFHEDFRDEHSPEGDPWAPLAERTIENHLYGHSRKRLVTENTRRRRRVTRQRGPEHILAAFRPQGQLERSIVVQVTEHSLAVGEYAKPGGAADRAEVGNPATNEPARPFIELTDRMETEAAALLLAYLEKLW